MADLSVKGTRATLAGPLRPPAPGYLKIMRDNQRVR